ncbi:MAG: hypothetical protein WA634_05315, partial [Silvibacterium sp.]
ADVVELPRAMHEAIAMQLVAALLNRNGVHIWNGSIWYSLDFWLLLLSGSGGGRSTLLQFARRIVEKALPPPTEKKLEFASPGLVSVVEHSNLINNCSWGSPQAFLQEFSDAELARNLFLWGEMGEKLALLNSGPFKQLGAKQWLTDRYDNPDVPEEIRYRRTGKPSDTEPIAFRHAPRINILAGSSEAWFYEFLQKDDSKGGWLPRWIFIRAGKRVRSCSSPVTPDSKLTDGLVKHIQRISQLSGEATMPDEIWGEYHTWYEATQRIFESHPNSALAEPYWNRHKGHILKLAVIYTASMGGDLVVTREAWERARAKSAELLKNIFHMLDTGMTAVGFTLKRYEDRIHDAGEDGMLRSEFTRAFQDDRDRERDLTTLLSGQVIHQFQKRGGGRPGTILVHRDHCRGRCHGCQIASETGG